MPRKTPYGNSLPDRAFVICRQDEPGNYEGWVVAVYVGDDEACKADMEHRQAVNPNARYYVVDKKLNPKSAHTAHDAAHETSQSDV